MANINNPKFKDIDDLDYKIETYLKQLLGIVWQRKKLESENLHAYNDLPNAQNRILEEIKLNEEIIKFLERWENLK